MKGIREQLIWRLIYIFLAGFILLFGVYSIQNKDNTSQINNQWHKNAMVKFNELSVLKSKLSENHNSVNHYHQLLNEIQLILENLNFEPSQLEKIQKEFILKTNQFLRLRAQLNLLSSPASSFVEKFFSEFSRWKIPEGRKNTIEIPVIPEVRKEPGIESAVQNIEKQFQNLQKMKFIVYKIEILEKEYAIYARERDKKMVGELLDELTQYTEEPIGDELKNYGRIFQQLSPTPTSNNYRELYPEFREITESLAQKIEIKIALTDQKVRELKQKTFQYQDDLEKNFLKIKKNQEFLEKQIHKELPEQDIFGEWKEKTNRLIQYIPSLKTITINSNDFDTINQWIDRCGFYLQDSIQNEKYQGNWKSLVSEIMSADSKILEKEKILSLILEISKLIPQPKETKNNENNWLWFSLILSGCFIVSVLIIPLKTKKCFEDLEQIQNADVDLIFSGLVKISQYNCTETAKIHQQTDRLLGYMKRILARYSQFLNESNQFTRNARNNFHQMLTLMGDEKNAVEILSEDMDRISNQFQQFEEKMERVQSDILSYLRNTDGGNKVSLASEDSLMVLNSVYEECCELLSETEEWMEILQIKGKISGRKKSSKTETDNSMIEKIVKKLHDWKDKLSEKENQSNQKVSQSMESQRIIAGLDVFCREFKEINTLFNHIQSRVHAVMEVSKLSLQNADSVQREMGDLGNLLERMEGASEAYSLSYQKNSMSISGIKKIDG